MRVFEGIDFVKLSANPYEAEPAGLAGNRAQRLSPAGRAVPYRSQSRGVVAVVVRGMAGRAKV